MVIGVVLVGCTGARHARDSLAELGIRAYARGTWTCQALVDDERVTITVGISSSGTFRLTAPDDSGDDRVQAGRWHLEGGRLSIDAPSGPLVLTGATDPPSRFRLDDGSGAPASWRVATDGPEVTLTRRAGAAGPATRITCTKGTDRAPTTTTPAQSTRSGSTSISTSTSEATTTTYPRSSEPLVVGSRSDGARLVLSTADDHGGRSTLVLLPDDRVLEAIEWTMGGGMDEFRIWPVSAAAAREALRLETADHQLPSKGQVVRGESGDPTTDQVNLLLRVTGRTGDPEPWVPDRVAIRIITVPNTGQHALPWPLPDHIEALADDEGVICLTGADARRAWQAIKRPGVDQDVLILADGRDRYRAGVWPEHPGNDIGTC